MTDIIAAQAIPNAAWAMFQFDTTTAPGSGLREFQLLGDLGAATSAKLRSVEIKIYEKLPV